MSQLLDALNQPRSDTQSGGRWQWGLPSAPVRSAPWIRFTFLLLLFFAGAGMAALGWQLWQQWWPASSSPLAATAAVAAIPAEGAEGSSSARLPARAELVTGIRRLTPRHWPVQPLPEAIPEPVASSPPVKAAESDSPAADPVSPALADAFRRALQTVPAEQPDERSAPAAWDNPPALPLAELPPALRDQVPSMSFNSHVYSSSPENRLVRVNGRELHEGQWLTAVVQLVEIRQDQVIMRVEGQSFSLPALAEWN